MARVKGAMMTRKRRKKVIKLAKGFWGSKKNHYKMANQQVMKSGVYAYVGRKLKKRDFRRLWISRISAACKQNDINYSRFMNGLKRAGVSLNRKMLSEIAISDSQGFAALVEKAKAALESINSQSAAYCGAFALPPGGTMNNHRKTIRIMTILTIISAIAASVSGVTMMASATWINIISTVSAVTCCVIAMIQLLLVKEAYHGRKDEEE